MKPNDLKNNQKLLIDAFQAQNREHYDVALQNLQLVGGNLINIIDKIQSNSEFYMKHMPLMKQERDLVPEKDYKEFISKNQKILCRNFEKNAYLALLMQQMEENCNKVDKKKWNQKQQQLFQTLIESGYTLKDLYEKFPKHSPQEIESKYQQSFVNKQKRSISQQKPILSNANEKKD